MPRRHLLRQFLSFAEVGIVGTLVHYGTLIALVQIAAVTPVLASGVGFVNGGLVNYFLNYQYTFRSSRPHDEAVIRFLTVALAGVALNTLIMSLCTDILDFHYLLAQVIATGIVVISNFAGNRWWTFGEGANATRR